MITLQNPAFLILLPILATLAWMLRARLPLSPLRILILILSIFLLCAPKLANRPAPIDLWVLLDQSASTETQVDQAQAEWLSILKNAKPHSSDRLRILHYAQDVIPSDAQGTTLDRSQTRTALALQYVTATANPERANRILLFTDGFSTEPITITTSALQQRRIPVDFRLLPPSLSRDARITNFSIKNRTQSNEPFLISTTIHANYNGKIPLIIRRNGQIVLETTANLINGTATINSSDRISQTGAHSYNVQISPENDTFTGNNHAQRWIEITGQPRILLLTSYPDDPIATALKTQNFQVNTISSPSQLNAASLSGVRAVIFNNIHASRIPLPFQKALNFYVHEQGGSLLMVGGRQSFGSGGYFQSPIDSLLPVSLELKKELRKLSLNLVISLDRSGSMSTGVPGGMTKMDLANQGAANAIELLSPMDSVALFAVDTKAHPILPLSPVGQQQSSLSNIARSISSEGGGIYIEEALTAAKNELAKAPPGSKHLILFADASDSEHPGNYQKIIDEMLANGTTISVIGMGTENDPDAPLLKEIAQRGKGRLYFTSQAGEIPQIFSMETASVARSAFLRQQTTTKATGKWLEISPQNLPWPTAVDGYNLSYLRPDATASLLSADEYLAPLLAHTRRGLGRTAAISFPLSGEFSALTRAWPQYGDFLQTLLRWLIPTEIPPGLNLRYQVEGNELHLDLLYDFQKWNAEFAKNPPKLKWQSQEESQSSPQKTHQLPWQRLAPGHLSAKLTLPTSSPINGVLQIANHTLAFGPINIPNSPEWNFNQQSIQELRQLSHDTHGQERTTLATSWENTTQLAPYNLHLPLILLLLTLFLLDALLTRISFQSPKLPKILAYLHPKKQTISPEPSPKTIPTAPSKNVQKTTKAPQTPPTKPSPESPSQPSPETNTQTRQNRYNRIKKRQ